MKRIVRFGGIAAVILAVCCVAMVVVGQFSSDESGSEVARQAEIESETISQDASPPTATPLPTDTATTTPESEEVAVPTVCDRNEYLAHLRKISALTDLEKSDPTQKTIVFKEGYVENVENVAYKKLFTESARAFKDLSCLDKVTLEIPLGGQVYYADVTKTQLGEFLNVDFADLNSNIENWRAFLTTSGQSEIDAFAQAFVTVIDLGNGYLSGGLGLSRSDWEQAHTATELDYQPIGTGYDNRYDVVFRSRNVWRIERMWGSDNFASTDMVEAESQTLIPADSQFVETYSPEGRSETVVSVYFSESLKGRFEDEDGLFGDPWIGGEPGNFIIQFNVYDGKVGRMIISIGNNP